MSKRPRSTLQVLATRPRLLLTLGLGLVLGWALPEAWLPHTLTRWLLAWNVSTLLYVALAGWMMVRSTHDHMRQRAQVHDDGQRVILLLVALAGLASLGAIAGELSLARRLQGAEEAWHVALAGATVLSSWAFIQVMFTVHYAHDYYAAVAQHLPPGLRFPDDDAPDYGDFFYFAVVIGTSAQTADVSFVSKPMRRVGTLHCLLAFFFNTTLLALLINIGASLV